MTITDVALAANSATDWLRFTSRGLGWGPLRFEHRDVAAPACRQLERGADRHLVAVSLGGGRVRCERGGRIDTLSVQPGTVSVHPAGQPVVWHFDTPLSYVVISLAPELLHEVAHATPGIAPEDFELLAGERENDSTIANVAGLLSHELVTAQPGNALYAQSLARILAVHLLRHYTAEAQPIVADSRKEHARVPPQVAKAMEYIHTHFAEDVWLEEVSRAAHCSSFHISRLFRQATGMTVSQYLIRVRVEHAHRLLSAGAGDRSLANVAHAAGFSDQSHLTRHMKRLMGVTPGRVRAA